MTKVSMRVWRDQQGMDDSLRPTNIYALAELHNFKHGQEIVIDLKGSRNAKQHRLLFGLLKFAILHSDYYANSTDLLTQIKYHLNMVDSVKVHGSDDVLIIPRSISFESMSQSDFANFLNEAIKIITEKLVPNLDSDSLNEYYSILDGGK